MASSNSWERFCLQPHLPVSFLLDTASFLSPQPKPLLKIRVYYDRYCFNSAMNKDISSYKVLWSENNIFKVRYSHCK